MVLGGSVNESFAQEKAYLFRVTLTSEYEPGTPFYAACEVLKEELAKIGIDVALVKVSAATYRELTKGANYPNLPTYEGGGLDMFVRGWTLHPSDMYYVEGCFSAKGHPPTGWNRMAWRNSVADDYLTKGAGTYDFEERKKAYWAWQEEYYKDLPCVDYMYAQEITPMKKVLVDVVGPPSYSGLGFHEQYWKVEGKTLKDNPTITIAATRELTGLMPMFIIAAGAYLVPMYSALIMEQRQPDGTFRVVPDLAESWDVSKDGTSITFHLRNDAKFHDGHPVTSKDVKFTIDATLDPKTAARSYSDVAAIIKSADIIDDYTVRVNLKSANPMALIGMDKFALAIVPEHILRDVPREALGSHWTNTEKAIGSGPFKFVEWKKGEYVKQEINLDWYGWNKNVPGWYKVPVPGIRYYVYRVIPEMAAAIIALEKGEVDMLGLEAWPSEEMDRLAKSRTDLRIEWVDTSRVYYFGFNTVHPILGNIDKIYGGHGTPAVTAIAPMNPFFNTNLKSYPYDLKRARELLALAGYKLPEPCVVPISAYVTPAVAGLVAGALIASLLTYYLTRKRKGSA